MAARLNRTVVSKKLSQGTSKRLRTFVMGVPLLVASWTLIWTQDTFWNPLFFLSMWVGATLLMYSAGEKGSPGWRRHAAMISISIPVWWWFELVNARLQNWEYIGAERYGRIEYTLLASLALSTVVPALHSAWGITTRALSPSNAKAGVLSWWAYVVEVLVGVASVVIVFAWPDLFFPLVWVGPFLAIDGLVGLEGGRSLTRDLFRGEWRLAAAVGLAGLMCGFLWEFWNYWATPKWVYQIAYFDYLDVFEMPLLGYGGYIPFAWSVYQLLHLRRVRRYLSYRSAASAPESS